MIANPRFVLTTHETCNSLLICRNLAWEMTAHSSCTAGCFHTCILWHMCIEQHNRHGLNSVCCEHNRFTVNTSEVPCMQDF